MRLPDMFVLGVRRGVAPALRTAAAVGDWGRRAEGGGRRQGPAGRWTEWTEWTWQEVRETRKSNDSRESTESTDSCRNRRRRWTMLRGGPALGVPVELGELAGGL